MLQVTIFRGFIALEVGVENKAIQTGPGETTWPLELCIKQSA